MIRALATFFQDTFSWLLIVLLGITVICGLTTLFDRHEKFERYKKRLDRMEYDITLLQNELDSKKNWIQRLESDKLALEQVAREKMNYLGPNEILVTFVPKKKD
jgi:cell division protein FtsB